MGDTLSEKTLGEGRGAPDDCTTRLSNNAVLFVPFLLPETRPAMPSEKVESEAAKI